MKKSNSRRADGRIAVQVYLGMCDGKRKYKTVYGRNQKEAQEKAAEIKALLKKGIDVDRDNDFFSTWARYWLESKRAETSADQYKLLRARAGYFQERLGDFKISKIKQNDLQKILNDLAACNPYTMKSTAKKTLSSYAQVISSIFEFAVDNRVLEYNPAVKLKIPQNAPQKKRRALSQEERNRVIEFKHRAQPSAMLMMFSGLRRGEATALTWNDVDLKNGTITVSRSYNFKQKEFKTPKNGKSRCVFIPKILVDYLSELPKNSIYVLTSANGKMLSDTAWKRLYDSYMFDMNLKFGGFAKTQKKFTPTKIPMVIQPFSPHELRHTFCTIMYESGIDVLSAKEQMGHSDVKTTLAIYTHLESQYRLNSISKLDEYLNKCKSNASQSIL